MSRLTSFFIKIYNFFVFDIWKIMDIDISKQRRFVYRILKTIIISVKGFWINKLNVNASALSYSILFAIIPLFAIIMAIGKGFGVDRLIENSLSDTYLARTNMLPWVMEFVDRYLKTAQGGVFIGVGFAILIWSVMNFFMQVETAFNTIWQVKKPRSLFRRYTMYFSSILLVPIIIVVTSGLSIYVYTALSKSFLYDVLSPFLRFGMKFSTYFLNWIIFTIMYMVIPNTRVRFNNALVAGIIAGSAFQIFQILYIHGQVYLSRYNVVYGSFAAIPLLLLWLQISSLIVLLGAEISYASQNFHNFEFELESKNISHRYENFLSLYVTYQIIKRFEEQKPALTSESLVTDHKLPIRLVNQILSRLVETSIIAEVYSETGNFKAFQPAMDINKLTISILYEKLDCRGSELFLKNNNPELELFWQKITDWKVKPGNYPEDLLIKDL